MGFQISKNGSSFAVSNTGVTNMTEVSDGWYLFDLDTTDTQQVGALYYLLTGVTLTNDAQLCDAVLAMQSGRPLADVVDVRNNAIGTSSFIDGALTAEKFAANAIGAGTISDAAKLALFTVPTLPEAYPALGAPPTPAKALLAVLQLLSNIRIVGTTLTVFGLDGTTPVMTFTLNNAVNPSSRTRST